MGHIDWRFQRPKEHQRYKLIRQSSWSVCTRALVACAAHEGHMYMCMQLMCRVHTAVSLDGPRSHKLHAPLSRAISASSGSVGSQTAVVTTGMGVAGTSAVSEDRLAVDSPVGMVKAVSTTKAGPT